MTTRAELESKIVQVVYSRTSGGLVVLCEDGSLWEREFSYEKMTASWFQLHPPHRAPEVKEAPSAVKPLRFSEVTKPGGYWVRPRDSSYPWTPCQLARTPDGWSSKLAGHQGQFVLLQDDPHSEAYEYFGPFPEPEVKP